MVNGTAAEHKRLPISERFTYWLAGQTEGKLIVMKLFKTI